MPRYPRKPPPVLLSSRVLEYAVLPKSTKFAGANMINWLEGKAIGSVPCLAIVESLRDGELILVYCDRDWSIRAFSTHESVARAKKRAEDAVAEAGKAIDAIIAAKEKDILEV